MDKKLKRDKYEIVLIAGNGFDLNLGLETSYNHFIESDNFKELISSNNSLANHLVETHALQNWIDVENELKKYSIKKDIKKLFKNRIESI